MKEETQNHYKEQFIKLMIRDRIKYESQKFYDAQQYYFSGILVAIGEELFPPAWVMMIMSRRPIVEKYKL